MTSSWRREAALVLIAWLIAGTTTRAQQSSVEVRSPSAKLLTAAPGRFVTASVVVANRGSETDEFGERLVLPPGCQRVAPPDVPFRLEAGAQIVRVLAVLIPVDMSAGQFSIRYEVQSRRDPASLGSIDLAVEVTSVENMELTISPGPAMVLAGDVYLVKLSLRNRGNSRVVAQLAHRSSLNFRVTSDVSALALEPGDAREIVSRVQTDKAFTRHAPDAVTVDVVATSSSGKSLTASQASVVQIVPVVSGNPDPMHYLPTQLRQTIIVESGRGALFQAELSGVGSLDEAGEHRVDFLFRGPDVQNASLFGERDEYGASYHGENFDLDLGDRVFALSPLTERHSLGRGAGLKWHDGATSAGAFYMSTRHRRENTEEFGAFVRHDFEPRFGLQVNFLRKRGGDALGEHALPQNIVSLEARWGFGKLLDLRVEAAVSRSDEGLVDHAYRAEARGQLPGEITYALEHVHAGPDFEGYYSDTDTTYATVAKRIGPKFRVHASLNRYEASLARSDVRHTVVNRENSWSGGANYSLTAASEIFLEGHHVDRTDILLPAAYDFDEDFARLGAGHNFGTLQLRGYVDLGALDDSLTDTSGFFQRYNVTASWRPTQRQTYSIFASYGPSAFTGSTDEALSAGISANWQLRADLTANLSYARNQYDGLLGREQDQALATLRYEFENKASLALVARFSRAISDAPRGSSSANESAVMITYSMPLGLPVSRKRSVGALHGRVADARNGAGLPRVVLQIGERFAVTDDAGAFEFHELKPGHGELRVVQDSLGAKMTMLTPLPMKVEIRGAETTRVALSATPGCSIAVRIARFEFADGSSLAGSSELREAGGQEGVAVEISNGRDVWRAQTDRTGSASFERLAPGEWTLRVAAVDLPAFHAIENADRTVSLGAGANESVAFRVLPTRRTLKILEHGTIR